VELDGLPEVECLPNAQCDAGSAAWGQACLTGEDLEAPVRAKLEAAAAKYFDLAAKGDVAGLKDHAIERVQRIFRGLRRRLRENQPSFAKAEG